MSRNRNAIDIGSCSIESFANVLLSPYVCVSMSISLFVKAIFLHRYITMYGMQDEIMVEITYCMMTVKHKSL